MNQFPQHIAVIMDGNGRWAEQRGLLRVAGHQAGAKSVRAIVKSCAEKKLKALTLFAFGLENQARPPLEVKALMALFVSALNSEIKELHQNNICLKIIGDRSYYSSKLLKLVESAEILTAQNTGLILTLAINYSGRWDIIQATQRLAIDVQNQRINSDEINPQLFNAYLSLSDEPDLLIRTSGEQRISNFLLWQMAYTELYFTDTLWPDFNESALELALDWYTKRERRFGLIKPLDLVGS